MKMTSRPKGTLWPAPDGYIGTFKNLWRIWRWQRSTVLWATILVPLLYHLALFFDHISKPYRVKKFYRNLNRGAEPPAFAGGRGAK